MADIGKPIKEIEVKPQSLPIPGPVSPMPTPVEKPMVPA